MTEIELESYFKIAIWGSPVVVLFLLILSAFFQVLKLHLLHQVALNSEV